MTNNIFSIGVMCISS